MESLLQTKVRLVGLIRGMNVVLTLNEPYFILPFLGSEPFIMKYRNMPRFQRYFMTKQVKVNVITEYWGVFVIRDRLNGD